VQVTYENHYYGGVSTQVEGVTVIGLVQLLHLSWLWVGQITVLAHVSSHLFLLVLAGIAWLM
jgi:hypothetical protein